VNETDRRALAEAKRLLTRPSFAARAVSVLGTPLERATALLPENARLAIAEATERAISKGLAWAVDSIDRGPPTSRRLHKGMAMVAGALGGAFGLPALVVELPASTLILLRDIATVARQHGEDLADPATRLACVQVFALGGFAKSDDAAETGYYAARTALAQVVTEAARYLAQESAAKKTAPALLRFISTVATRFGVVVSDKVMLTAVPVIGAVSGAALNAVFSDHFHGVASGHFTVRRLERAYGEAEVRRVFAELSAD
jgi:hypothetical protein